MKKLLASLFILTATTAFAQDKMLTIDNAVFAAREGLTPARLSQLGWVKGIDEYYFVDKSGVEETLKKGKADSRGEANIVITLSELSQLVMSQNQTGVATLKSFPLIKWISPDQFRFDVLKSTFTYTLSTKKMSAQSNSMYPETAAAFDEAPLTRHMAYTVDNNLFIYNSISKETSPVTSEVNPAVVCGQSVHRDEFGIYKGTYWSPSGKMLAYYRMDQTMVTDYPILDLSKQPAQSRFIKYPMAGGASHQVTLGIYNTETKKTIFISDDGPRDQYLTNIAWSPDNQFIYIAIVNRDQNHLWLNCYKAATGEFVKTLFEETDSKYVHPMHPMQFVPMNPDQFIWQSERISRLNPTGANQIYLYNVNGELLRTMAAPPAPDDKNAAVMVVTDCYGFDPMAKFLYYQTASLDQCDRAIYSFDMKKGLITKLTNTKGTHQVSFSSSCRFFIDDFSSLTVPRIQSIYNAAGKETKTLFTAPNPLAAYKKCNVRLFTITAADGETPLWCRMLTPAGFDSTKKYPSFTYVYNGPNVQLVQQAWLGGADLFLYYMAQQGYVVFTVDGRGSDGRGIRFEQATFRHLGTEEIADQEKGNQYLRSLSYIDSKRMAVYGWSFGGFMTTSLMTRKPGLYACGVAGGAVIDWSYYEIMYTERYMDTPEQNPDGYKESALTNYVQNLKGKLLEIHGTSDDVVVWQHTLLYTKACVEAGTQTDYYMYPGHPHNVRGKDRVHLLTKVSDYIMTNTK
jgi:dipeptidyl-peptidase 4